MCYRKVQYAQILDTILRYEIPSRVANGVDVFCHLFGIVHEIRINLYCYLEAEPSQVNWILASYDRMRMYVARKIMRIINEHNT